MYPNSGYAPQCVKKKVSIFTNSDMIAIQATVLIVLLLSRYFPPSISWRELRPPCMKWILYSLNVLTLRVYNALTTLSDKLQSAHRCIQGVLIVDLYLNTLYL